MRKGNRKKVARRNSNQVSTSKSAHSGGDGTSKLEKALLSYVLPNLTVPTESGVRFRISPNDSDKKGICLLIRIDDPQKPLCDPGVKRPDYLALYLSGEGCICTIIEMKGKTEAGAKHGIDQIKELKRILEEQFRAHLHPGFRFHIQGILLSPPNSQTVAPILAKLSREIVILPLQSSNRAELFPYVSRKHDTIASYTHTDCRTPRRPSQSESLFCMSKTSLMPTDGRKIPRANSRPSEGIHLKYVPTDAGVEVVFVSDPDKKQCHFYVKSADSIYAETLRSEFEACGLLNTKFIVQDAQLDTV